MTSPLLRPSVVSTAGLVGGFAVARATRREVGGAVFAAAGAWCGREWARTSGPVAASALSALYTAAMGGSHPLSRRLGAWPSVLAVAGAVALASEVVPRVVRR